MLKPALFFDFDNTLTDGDVLDQVIEEFSPNELWRDWENAWEDGRLPARDCLRLQIENLRVTREDLLHYLTQVRVDPAFAAIVDWAKARQVDVNIVSDSFLPLIHHILLNNGIDVVPVFANDLSFSGDRLIPAFPFYDPACARSANTKARHLAAYNGHTIIFAGDGHSDLDAALSANVVFAKSTLARELGARGATFHPFGTLEPVLEFLETQARRGGAEITSLRAARPAPARR
ncbi:MAG TPA: MtnX-like HAD-IB family phosphatase [Burkholderiales bacterium]|jgi:2,3-diketo-5-methylthio-1-phosphopentane phosphatase